MEILTLHLIGAGGKITIQIDEDKDFDEIQEDLEDAFTNQGLLYLDGESATAFYNGYQLSRVDMKKIVGYE